MYIHFVVRGEEVEMAKGTREALALTKSPLVSTPSGPEAKPELAKEIERIIGTKAACFPHHLAPQRCTLR